MGWMLLAHEPIDESLDKSHLLACAVRIRLVAVISPPVEARIGVAEHQRRHLRVQHDNSVALRPLVESRVLHKCLSNLLDVLFASMKHHMELARRAVALAHTGHIHIASGTHAGALDELALIKRHQVGSNRTCLWLQVPIERTQRRICPRILTLAKKRRAQPTARLSYVHTEQ